MFQQEPKQALQHRLHMQAQPRTYRQDLRQQYSLQPNERHKRHFCQPLSGPCPKMHRRRDVHIRRMYQQ